VGLPRDTRTTGKNTKQHAAVEQDNQHGPQDAADAPFEISEEQKETEVAENDAAGADMDGTGWTDEPDAHATDHGCD